MNGENDCQKGTIQILLVAAFIESISCITTPELMLTSCKHNRTDIVTKAPDDVVS